MTQSLDLTLIFLVFIDLSILFLTVTDSHVWSPARPTQRLHITYGL